MRTAKPLKAKFDDGRCMFQVNKIRDSEPSPGSIQNHFADRPGKIESLRATTAGIEIYGLVNHSAKRLMTMPENHQIHCLLFNKHLEFLGRPSTVPDDMLNHDAPACHNGCQPHRRQSGRIHVSRNTGDRGNALKFRQDRIRTYIASMEDMIRVLAKLDHVLRKASMRIGQHA